MNIPFSRLEEAIQDDEYAGFCLACGNMQYEVEPDAREYTCEECGEKKVYGAEEILIMGNVDYDDDDDDDDE